jgi:hypothetical protein
MSRELFDALDRLARSSWGQQGTGFCPRSRTRTQLINLEYAFPVGQRRGTMRLTLKGFQALHAEALRTHHRMTWVQP